MAITAFGSAGYVQCPPGLHHSVCVDVEDLGVEVSDKYFNEKTGEPNQAHKIRIVWQIEDPVMDDGRRFTTSKKFTLSLNEKASLRKFLESWRGIPFTKEDLVKGFDVEKLIGVNCTLQVLQTEDGKYTNVVNIMPPTKGASLLQPENYTRKKDRPQEAKAPDAARSAGGLEIEWLSNVKPKAMAAQQDDGVEVPF